MNEQRLNAYYCDVCRGYVVTVDRDEGTTPMFLACRVKGEPDSRENDCRGRSESMGYPELPWPAADAFGTAIPTEPTWEWYRPGDLELREASPEMFEHFKSGGLALRKIEP